MNAQFEGVDKDSIAGDYGNDTNIFLSIGVEK